MDVLSQGRLTGVFAPQWAARGASVRLRPDPAGCLVFAEGAVAAEPLAP